MRQERWILTSHPSDEDYRGVVDALAHAHFGPVYLVDCHSERNPVDPRYAADSISTESSTATWPGLTVDP